MGICQEEEWRIEAGITVHCVTDRIVQRRDPQHHSNRRLRRCKRSWATFPRFWRRPRALPVFRAAGSGCRRAGSPADSRGATRVRAFGHERLLSVRPARRNREFFRTNVDDDDFTELFRAALETEIENRDAVGKWLELFPIREIGVAQGSLLSVLAGNVALRHFDASMNSGELTTIRYLDDFLILASSLEIA